MKLYNTLTRTVEPFEPKRPPTVTMYVCGPTVYDEPHIGHVRSAFTFDVLRRALESHNWQVQLVRNVTDVDDKIIEKARQELARGQKSEVGSQTNSADLKQLCVDVSQRYLRRYHEVLERLQIAPPTVEPLATEHVVPEMTDFIAKLSMQGVAYEAGGDVYFAVRKFAGYGRLSNRSLDELQAGVRIEPGEHKHDPLDFALWKAAKPGEPSWKSPWGEGRPGWHIECSAMSTKYLGDEFDIHGGGLDLIFPHHENEVAQAHAAGKPFARVWVHHGLVTVRGEKMSKSVGNFVTVDEVLQQAHPDYLKIFFLKTHYRSPIDFATERITEAKKNWEEFSRFFQHFDQKAGGVSGGSEVIDVADQRKAFEQALADDLNTPKALAVLFDLVNLGHRALESGADTLLVARGVRDTLLECGRVLGLFTQGLSDEPAAVLQRVQALVRERDEARQQKNFARADEIRNQLQLAGFLLTDTAGGTLWRRKA